MNRNTKVKSKFKKGVIFSALLVTVAAVLVSSISGLKTNGTKLLGESTDKSRQNEIIVQYANANGINLKEYPDSLVELLERNSETEEFVLEYPLNKDKDFEIDLSEYDNSDSVPLFLQWDKRWGYKAYGNGIIAINGCGPVCLSMTAVYLLNNTEMNPLWMSNFSKKNGYYIPNNGTSWSLISEGADKLGLKATELPLDENTIIKNLNAGKPVICVMGPGDFTSTGHYIVITGYENGGFKVNDPNSVNNSNKTWYYENIKDQFRNLWAMERK